MSVLAIDRSKDYAYFDSPLTVGYVRKTGAGAWGPSVNVDFVQRQMVATDAEREDTTRRTYYTLWRDRLSAAGLTNPPKRNDHVSEGGFVYCVLAVEHCDLDAAGVAQRFRCLCLQVSQ